jgi:hypothetical protein
MDNLRNKIKEQLKLLKEDVNNIKLIDESSLNRLLSKHYKDGFIIVTSYRGGGEKTDKENKEDFNELKQIVRGKGYSFIPVYGGFIENYGEEDEREVREPALLIPNQKVATHKSYENDGELFKMGVELINKYNQDSFLHKKPGEENIAQYINKSGNIDMTFKDKSVNDLTQVYFTDLAKTFSKPKETSGFDKKTK